MALSKWTGTDVWIEMQHGKEVNSNWLLMERGYEYSDVGGRLFIRNMQGEDELHPIHITAFGEGTQPVIDELPRMYQDPSSNVVVSDIHFTAGVQILEGSNILLEDITLTGEGLMNIQNVDGFTLRDSDIWDIRYEEAPEDRSTWWAHTDRTQGIFMSGGQDVLIENNLFDHNGWADDYREDASTEGGQAPSQYSQNVYLSYNNLGVTFRDNISMQASSFGAQIRGGGLIEDNAFLDNNAGVNFLGGDVVDGEKTGQFTLLTSNVITSGAHKVAPNIGGLTYGIEN
ncbi:right-handed parallel beta-helix repeat-containing protein, partial [uncultured Roseobacter sp.]|uniref:right-handed parallel beta-helix repeat-containing protein n=1 Tax=uncultured Roseobacter sp. TaxID=114847 RepID=UPI0026277533